MARPCAIYARFSSEKQNPLSCQDQIRACQEYASAMGWETVGSFQDDGISGTLGRETREGWDQLLKFIEQGQLPTGGCVLTWNIDRWSRQYATGMKMAMEIAERGIALADTKDGLMDQDSVIGRLMLAIKSHGADDFIQNLQRNVKRGLAAKREAGYWTQPPPYGFNTEKTAGGSVLAPHPDEAPWVVKIFQLLDSGKSPAGVARYLNNKNVRTKNGRFWNPSTVKGIAKSPTFIGKIVRYNSRRYKNVNRTNIPKDQIEIYEGRHDALIPTDLFERVQERLKIVHRGPNSRRIHPLGEKVRCGDCGGRCVVTGGVVPYRYYRCRPYGSTNGCTSTRYIRVDRLEAAVAAWARLMARDNKAIHKAALTLAETEWRESRAAAKDRQPIEAEVQNLTIKQARLLDAIEAGNAPQAVNDRLARIDEQLQEARGRLATLGEAVDPIPSDQIAGGIMESLEGGAVDLIRLHEIVEAIVLPSDAGDRPQLLAFGKSFQV